MVLWGEELRAETAEAQMNCLRQALDGAEAVVVGAGAGMSASAGLTYSGGRFEAHFADFIAKCGYHDMYEAGFFPYGSPEEFWAYWSRHIYWNRYDQPVGQPYRDLLALMQGKNYFVITTNVDHCFQLAGFEKERLFYTQGDYGLWQCAKPCCLKTFDNEALVRRMVAEQKDMRVPAELVPHCPVCGGPMRMNLRTDGAFVEDAGWHAAQKRCQDFLRRHKAARVLYLELGVGGSTPGIIKYPFRRLTYENRHAVYACVNLTDAFAPGEIAQRSICVCRDIGEVLSAVMPISAG